MTTTATAKKATAKPAKAAQPKSAVEALTAATDAAATAKAKATKATAPKEQPKVHTHTTLGLTVVVRDTLEAYKQEIGAESLGAAISALLTEVGYDMASVES